MSGHGLATLSGGVPERSNDAGHGPRTFHVLEGGAEGSKKVAWGSKVTLDSLGDCLLCPSPAPDGLGTSPGASAGHGPPVAPDMVKPRICLCEKYITVLPRTLILKTQIFRRPIVLQRGGMALQ